MEVLLAEVRPPERPLAAAQAVRFEYKGKRVDYATLLLTDQRLLASKDRTFGHRRLDLSIDIRTIKEAGWGLLYGVGPAAEVQFKTEPFGFGTVMFSMGNPAEDFLNYLMKAVRPT